MTGLLRTIAAATAVALAIVGGVAAAGWGLYRDLNMKGPLPEQRTVVIPREAGVAGIARLLADRGVIRHALTFRLSVALSGLDGELVAGEYAFPARVSPRDAIDMLASGDTLKRRFTVPEGLTTAEVANLLARAPGLAGDLGPLPPDGALMPDTYLYNYGDKRRDMIARMRSAMTQAVAAAWAERLPDLPLKNSEQMLILASIVEKETAVAAERAHVAAVFLNRLRLGMPLQSDPTVIYVLSEDGAKKFAGPLTHADLAVASPYNTYVTKGLPPGPIDNPGWASLVAAARPAASQDLYFVADGNGGHAFAKGLADHLANVRRYRQEQAALAVAAVPAPADPPAEAHPPKIPGSHLKPRLRIPGRHATRIAKKKGAQRL